MIRDPYEKGSWAYRQKVGNPNRKLILTALAMYAEANTGYCYASQDDLAEFAECSVSSVRRHVGALEDAGLVAVHRRSSRTGRLPNEYLVRFPWVDQWPNGEKLQPLATGQISNRSNWLVATHMSAKGEREVRGEGVVKEGQDAFSFAAESSLSLPVAPASAPTREGGSKPCWEEYPPDWERWAPTYVGLDPVSLKAYTDQDKVWVEPKPEQQVFDFWRDLHWHFDAQPVAAHMAPIRKALEHYDVRMVCRAIGGGLTDPYIQGAERSTKYDTPRSILKLEQSDNVNRLSALCGDEHLNDLLEQAENNRMGYEIWRAQDFKLLYELMARWRFDNASRLRKDAPARMERYLRYVESRKEAA